MRGLLVAASALLFSIAAHAQPAGCAKSCKVVITMSAGCGSGIKVAPDPLFIAPNADVDIEWEILSGGWAFDGANGIAIHLEGEHFAKAPGSSKAHKRKHKNKGPKAFKYDVNLVDVREGPTKGQKCQLDPTIVDQ